MPARDLIGRAERTREIDSALDKAARGVTQVVVVRGPAGIGKTALLEYAAGSGPHDAIVLRASGHEAEAEIPYAGIHQLVSGIHGAVTALPEPHRGHLSRVLGYEAGDPVDGLAAANSLLTLIARLAETRPVVILVDDAQWLDASSRQALIFAVRRLDADAVCLLIGVRPEGEADFDGLGSVVDVEPLGPDESREFLRRRHPDLSMVVVDRVLDQAAGLPLALSEIPMELTEGQRAGTEPQPATYPVGSSIARLYGRRLDQLDDAARMALLLASFDDLDAPLLREVLAEHSLSLAAFETAERLHLVRIRDGRCTFAHPTVPFAVQSHATARELGEAHVTLAETFRDEPGRRAWHLQGHPKAGEQEIAAALVAAAEQAMQQGGFVEAGRAWETASRRITADPEGHRCRGQAIACYLRAGAGPQVKTLLPAVISKAADDVEAARWWRIWAVVTMWVDGRPPANRAELADLGVALLGRGAPAAITAGTDLLLALVVCDQAWGDLHAARDLVDSVRARVPVRELPLVQRLTCDVIDVMTGAPRAGTVLRSDWIDTFDWSTVADPGVPVGLFGVVLGWIDAVDECDRVARRCRALVRPGAGLAAVDLAIGSMSAIVLQNRGQWSRAALEYADSDRMAQDTDFVAPLPFVRLRRAYLSAARGRAAECAELRSRAVSAARTWTPAYRHLDACVNGLLSLTVGEPARAGELLDEAARLEREMGSVISGFTSRFPDQFEAYWRQGRAAELEGDLAEFGAAARRMNHPTMLATAARCRALIADADDMDGAFEEAMAHHAASPSAFESARTSLLWGQRLRRARRRADARRRLRVAEPVFEDVGARAWVDTVRAELLACGERRAEADEVPAGPIATLTPREFAVAREVALGGSNPEVADRLFISRRTVEYHLSNVYRKLDVPDRDRLAELFRQ